MTKNSNKNVHEGRSVLLLLLVTHDTKHHAYALSPSLRQTKTERTPSRFRPSSNVEARLPSPGTRPARATSVHIPLSHFFPNHILTFFSLQIQQLWALEFHALTTEGHRPMKRQSFTQRSLGATGKAEHLYYAITFGPDTRMFHRPHSQQRSEGVGRGVLGAWVQ